MNKLFYGDNLDIIRKHIKDETVDLCYIDPPFNSKRDYNQIYNNIGTEDKAQAIAFTDKWEWDIVSEVSYNEIIANKRKIFPFKAVRLIKGLSEILEKGSMFAYIVSMTLRIAEIHRVLKPTGSFYLHCDPTASHYLKLVLDAVFCSQGGDFRNEIVWHYRRWTGKSKKFQSMHDTVFFYSKSKDLTFNELYIPYTEKSLKRKKHHHTRIKGDDVFVTSVNEKGVRENDVWQIPLLNSQSKERLGYPTQKPEALLERIIKASSNEGDLVLDAYCGCGTTVAVAQRLNRKWLGIDITYQSIAVIKKRLVDTYGNDIMKTVETNGIPVDMASAKALANKEDDKTRKEFEKWAVLTYTDNQAMVNEKKGKDGGIDGRLYIPDGDTHKEVLFSVKSGKAGVKDVRDLRAVIDRENAAAGVLITLEKPTKDMLKEAAVAGFYTDKYYNRNFDKIKIITIEQMLAGDRVEFPLIADPLKKAEANSIQNYIQPIME
jgi:site-specific DNA-methyltransferase (adenine-specific)